MRNQRMLRNKNAARNEIEGSPTATESRVRKRGWIIGGVAAAVLAVGVALAYGVTRTPSGNGNPISNMMASFQPLGTTNILLIGNNARNPTGPLDIGTQGGGQADIMMLAHIQPSQHKVELISIPRDMLFGMPQYNISIPKIKSLFFIGGQMQPNQAAQLTVQAVEKFTGMPIRYWVVADFQGFADAIDAVGGVRIDVPGRIYDPAHSGANLFPGWQTLNGQQALAYVRVRQNTASSVSTNDFERDDVQAQILAALQKKLLNGPADLTRIPGLIRTWNKDVATNMSLDLLVRAANTVRGSSVSHMDLANVGDSMDVMSAPVSGINQQGYLTGAYYDIVDPAKVTKALLPYGSTGGWTGIPLPKPSEISVDLYGSDAYAQVLEKAGYHVTVMGGGGTSQVQVDYPPGHLDWGLQVGRTLATGNSVVQMGNASDAVTVYGP